jgi:hypothetical protein
MLKRFNSLQKILLRYKRVMNCSSLGVWSIGICIENCSGGGSFCIKVNLLIAY